MAIALVAAGFFIARATGTSARGTVSPLQSTASSPSKFTIPFAEAESVLTEFRLHLPRDLRDKSPAELRTAWSSWIAQHDLEVRRRLDSGDQESLVNLWYYGTSFTSLPRVTALNLEAPGAMSGEALLLGRLDDLVAGAASPGENERLEFARTVFERHGIDFSTPSGHDRARFFLVDVREQTLAEQRRYRKATTSVQPANNAALLTQYSSLFQDRGLSSDTSIEADLSVEQAFATLGFSDTNRRIRRVAIVGPGLDFTDKAEGYDFYPLQTIQPFAVIDSLVRHGLASVESLAVTTLDVSPRVNQHLEIARLRSATNGGYVLQLPLDRDTPARQWNPRLVTYWQSIGNQIGADIAPLPQPAGAPNVRTRAVRVRPDVVNTITPVDLNIVLERLDRTPPFDLIIATNVLVYYNGFEQALALTNIASMLAPRGLFLSNYAVAPPDSMQALPALTTSVSFDRQGNGDTMFWYEKK